MQPRPQPYAPRLPSHPARQAEWREGLSSEEYRVLRQKGTERPGSGEYNKFAPEDVCRRGLKP